MDRVAEAYHLAQRAVADLKGAILMLLHDLDSGEGLTNAEIGRRLGIHGGHVRHAGHISRTMLARMESDGIVVQDETTKCWRVR